MERVDGRPGVGCATFDEVLTRYQADIYRFGAQLTRDRGEADNLYQETVLTAFHAFDDVDRPASCRAWLFTIATNAFLSDRRHRGPEVSRDDERAAEVRSTSSVHTDRLDSHTLLQEVEAFVAALPLQQRVALVQRKYHDLSYAEIAATLGCSEAVARTSVYEAVRTLRARIGDRL
ncbi:MAG: RNA polymerase sigma factor [Chloroflexi bacterium]|nr:RNA polymerase sigma factor [Chloroflexota bacterium]